METFLVFLLIVVVAAIWFGRKTIRHVTIYDFQKGLLYRNGEFVREVGAGRYRVFQPTTNIEVYDLRKAMLALPGQDILTKDKINLKLSLAGAYEVADPLKARKSSQYYTSQFYADAQMALRDIVAGLTLDEVLEQKNDLDARLLEAAKPKAEALGLSLSSLAIRDIMLPANLKRAYAGVIEAQKEAQRQLEKARGEQAVLRNLANSAKMYDNNPSLLQARIVQSLAEGGNTIVFNADGGAIVPHSKSAP